jgi:hypothetical protein
VKKGDKGKKAMKTYGRLKTREVETVSPKYSEDLPLGRLANNGYQSDEAESSGAEEEDEDFEGSSEDE